MKTGNVIFVIFLWLILFPIIIIIGMAGVFASLFGGSMGAFYVSY